MSHLTLHPTVRVNVATTDTALLDAIETDLPKEDADVIGPEYDTATRSDVPESDETRLSARVTFVSDANGEQAATDLYNALTAHSLPSDATVDHYKSPVGIVSVEDVRKWHEKDAPDCDCDGFNPMNHTVASF